MTTNTFHIHLFLIIIIPLEVFLAIFILLENEHAWTHPTTQCWNLPTYFFHIFLNPSFSEAFGKIDNYLNYDAYVLLQKAQNQSQEGIHLADSFETLLKCVQVLLISTTLIESAVEMEGSLYFIPLHTLPDRKKDTIAKHLKSGLDTIVARTGKKSLFGRLSVCKKKQNQIDPYLMAFYNVYSLVANLTQPYHNILPVLMSFTIDVNFIPEGVYQLILLLIILH